jgi:hypothetical protein
MTARSDDIIVDGDCWLAYFDLLGFSSKVKAYAQQRRAELTFPDPRRGFVDGPEPPSGPYTQEEVNAIKKGVQCRFVDGLGYLAFEYREKVLKALKDKATYQRQYERTLHYAHFSDTFILYTPDESRESFETLSSAAGNFFVNMLYDGEPLRGAMTCGSFYADKDKSILIGTALIDAHEYAEKQDWIGYVLTPQAVEKLSKMKPSLEYPGNYLWWKVPVKVEKTICSCGVKMVVIGRERLLAFQGGSYPRICEAIHEMENGTRVESRNNYRHCRSKYRRTLRFIEHTKSMRSSRLTME